MLTTLVWDTIMWSLLLLRGNAPYHLRSLLSFLMGDVRGTHLLVYSSKYSIQAG